MQRFAKFWRGRTLKCESLASGFLIEGHRSQKNVFKRMDLVDGRMKKKITYRNNKYRLKIFHFRERRQSEYYLWRVKKFSCGISVSMCTQYVCVHLTFFLFCMFGRWVGLELGRMFRELNTEKKNDVNERREILCIKSWGKK